MTTPKKVNRLIELFRENRYVSCFSAYNETGLPRLVQA